ncbi:MAG: hypothetical protein DWQ07_02105 [Chloroflexi bacterium]|nr:MAG: hypothetical protein DWQ07_02105 [Chloroflexota bacterium]MBL1193709.1 hypothetical protein [Chloroflexota bacterium]NOH11002.1 hypothetical protein [Chloroflexota bacterium]
MAIQTSTPKQRTLLQSKDEEKQQHNSLSTDQLTAATWQYLDREISVDQFAESIDKFGDFVDLLDDSQ